MGEKVCSKCGEVKAVEDFYRDRSRDDGLSNRCKPCILNDRAAYRAANREKLRLGAARDRRRVPERGCWHQMIHRCTNPQRKLFENYGGRGITVCDRWLRSFEAFVDDMGPRPSLQHSVERINNDGNYEPGNCRWATRAEQARNKRTSRMVTVFGRTQCLADWADELKLSYHLLSDRLRLDWDVETAFSTPARRQRHGLTIDGLTLSIAEWSRRSGHAEGTIAHRLDEGLSPKRAVFDPVQVGVPLKRRAA